MCVREEVGGKGQEGGHRALQWFLKNRIFSFRKNLFKRIPRDPLFILFLSLYFNSFIQQLPDLAVLAVHS